jgi:hypothetical protein
MLLGEAYQRIDLINIDGDVLAFGQSSRAAIAWGDEKVVKQGGLSQPMGDGMFAAAAADKKHFHLNR